MSDQEETNLINGALGRFGAARISSIDDPSPVGNWCKTYYPNLRRALIDIGTWSFAEGRAQLSQMPNETPLFEFAFTYGLPSDIIRIKSYNGSLLQPIALDPLYWQHYLNWYKI